MPSVEYGFGAGGYVDTAYDPEMNVGATMPRVSNQAHTMVINNHFYQPGSWDPSQYYAPAAADPYYAYTPSAQAPPQGPAYYNMGAHQGQELSGSGYYGQQTEYPSAGYPRASFQGPSASGPSGYYQGYPKH